MLNRFYLLSTIALVYSFAAMGQTKEKNEYEQSQSRIIEPKQDVFIVPLVADIEILDNQVRQEYGPYEFDVPAGVETLSYDMLEEHKKSSLYRAAKEANADLIVAATFNVYAKKMKGKIISIELSGYPGKYINFRSVIKDNKDGDYQWIPIIYPQYDRLNDATGKTKALKDR